VGRGGGAILADLAGRARRRLFVARGMRDISTKAPTAYGNSGPRRRGLAGGRASPEGDLCSVRAGGRISSRGRMTSFALGAGEGGTGVAGYFRGAAA